LLPKYDHKLASPLEDHINKFSLAIGLMNVKHEYMVSIRFPHTSENTTSTWYFNLPVGSITNWGDFHKSFLDKFGEENTNGALMSELLYLFMSPKERVKYFNQMFTMVSNKFKYGTELT